MDLMKVDTSQLAAAGLSGANTLTREEAEESTGIKANAYLPYTKLIQPQAVKDSKQYGMGSFVIFRGSKDKNPVNLGDSFAGVPLSIRGSAKYFGEPKGFEYDCVMGGKRNTTDKYTEYVEAAKTEKKNGITGTDSDYSIGLEVLFWLPEIDAYTYFCATSVSTVAAVEESISQYVADFTTGAFTPVLISSVEREKGDFCWCVPECNLIDGADTTEWPELDFDSCITAMKQFNDPKPVVEGAEKVEETARKR